MALARGTRRLRGTGGERAGTLSTFSQLLDSGSRQTKERRLELCCHVALTVVEDRLAAHAIEIFAAAVALDQLDVLAYETAVVGRSAARRRRSLRRRLLARRSGRRRCARSLLDGGSKRVDGLFRGPLARGEDAALSLTSCAAALSRRSGGGCSSGIRSWRTVGGRSGGGVGTILLILL